MTKRASEGELGDALRGVDLAPLYVLKLPDDSRNWKPCDYLVWLSERVDIPSDGSTLKLVSSIWFEAKDVDTVAAFNWTNELRPSQIAGIRDAGELGIPYWLAVYWRKSRTWTISDAHKIAAWIRENHTEGRKVVLSKGALSSTFGIDSSKQLLPSVLKDVLLGGI